MKKFFPAFNLQVFPFNVMGIYCRENNSSKNCGTNETLANRQDYWVERHLYIRDSNHFRWSQITTCTNDSPALMADGSRCHHSHFRIDDSQVFCLIFILPIHNGHLFKCDWLESEYRLHQLQFQISNNIYGSFINFFYAVINKTESIVDYNLKIILFFRCD